MIFDRPHITIHELQPQTFLLLLGMPRKDLYSTLGFFPLFWNPFSEPSSLPGWIPHFLLVSMPVSSNWDLFWSSRPTMYSLSYSLSTSLFPQYALSTVIISIALTIIQIQESPLCCIIAWGQRLSLLFMAIVIYLLSSKYRLSSVLDDWIKECMNEWLSDEWMTS